MKVELVWTTPNALDVLLATKLTRLGSKDEIAGWSEDKKKEELSYVLNTIQSSWEFIDYHFRIKDVTRAFCQQLERHRHGSFAELSQRSVNMGDFGFEYPNFDEDDCNTLNGLINHIRSEYAYYASKYSLQDARSILPMNALTSIECKFNLRSLSEMAKVRLCYRTQGEFQNVFKEMRNRVIEEHPWAEPFIRVHCAAVGVCCFPRFKECPIKPGIFDPDSGWIWGKDGSLVNYALKNPKNKEQIQKDWEETMFEADPSIRR